MAKRIRATLDELCEEISVDAPGMWENDQGPEGWYAVTTPSGGIVAYFAHESDAFRFRLDLINQILNQLEPDHLDDGLGPVDEL